MKSFSRAAVSAGFQTPIPYIEFVSENAQKAHACFQSLYITYTQFFRDPLLFAYLEQKTIPGLIRNAQDKGEIRIWSAGCATGQEAYSLAMLLDEQSKSIGKQIDFRVFATDVSSEALYYAENGVYTSFEMQNVKLKYMQTYFSESNGKYAISHAIKDRVSFSNYDLLDTTSVSPPDCIFGDFDLVCCNNILMYYKSEYRKFILRKIDRSLSADGVLTVSEPERPFIKTNTGFQPVSTSVAMFHKPGYSGEVYNRS